jgi:hypothetical protein
MTATAKDFHFIFIACVISSSKSAQGLSQGEPAESQKTSCTTTNVVSTGQSSVVAKKHCMA